MPDTKPVGNWRGNQEMKRNEKSCTGQISTTEREKTVIFIELLKLLWKKRTYDLEQTVFIQAKIDIIAKHL